MRLADFESVCNDIAVAPATVNGRSSTVFGLRSEIFELLGEVSRLTSEVCSSGALRDELNVSRPRSAERDTEIDLLLSASTSDRDLLDGSPGGPGD